MLLSNGSVIKNDVIESYNRACANTENWEDDGSMNWRCVDVDMHRDLGGIYSSEYLRECLDTLASADDWV